jgi:hypothetical protein
MRSEAKPNGSRNVSLKETAESGCRSVLRDGRSAGEA